MHDTAISKSLRRSLDQTLGVIETVVTHRSNHHSDRHLLVEGTETSRYLHIARPTRASLSGRNWFSADRHQNTQKKTKITTHLDNGGLRVLDKIHTRSLLVCVLCKPSTNQDKIIETNRNHNSPRQWHLSCFDQYLHPSTVLFLESHVLTLATSTLPVMRMSKTNWHWTDRVARENSNNKISTLCSSHGNDSAAALNFNRWSAP